MDTRGGCLLPCPVSTGSPAVKSPIDEAIRLPPTQSREVSIDTAVRAGVTGPLDHSMCESPWRGLWASVNSTGRRRASAEELRGGDGELALTLRPARQR